MEKSGINILNLEISGIANFKVIFQSIFHTATKFSICEQDMFVTHYTPVSNKAPKIIFKLKFKVNLTRSLTLVLLQGHLQWGMNGKSEVSISYSSKVIAKVKVENTQKNRQDKNKMPPIIRSRGINIVAAFWGMHVSPAKQSSARLPGKCDYRTNTPADAQTDRRRTKWSLCAAMLCRRHNKTQRHKTFSLDNSTLRGA